MTGTIDVMQWSPAELKRRLDDGAPLALLDVREHDERDFVALAAPPCARELHVPIGSIPERLDAIRRLAEGRPLVVYCHHGMRSTAAGRWLLERGVAEVANLDGGIDAWSRVVDPDLPRY